jgi:hypothetical protein
MAKAVLKTCPWCGGALIYEKNYPVMRLLPGETRTRTRVDDKSIPEPLKTVPAWACATAMCRYREPA